MATEVILLEKIEKLGGLGEVVKVKPGYARNYLLPENKALRATKENIAYFESVRKQLEKSNEEKRSAAEKIAKKINNLKVVLIRQASESGHLYGSVSSRDISEVIAEKSKQEIAKNQVVMNHNYKEIGIFPVEIMLHPEVKVSVSINIARSNEEAALQEKEANKPAEKETKEDKVEISADNSSEAETTEAA